MTATIDVLAFICKYMSVIALAHYFISRSGELIKKKESVTLRSLFRVEIVGVCFMLALIIGSKFEIYMKASQYDENSDPYKDIVNHHFHKWEGILDEIFWLLANILQMCIGIKISRAVLNSNLALMLLEKDSFYRQGTIALNICQMR